VSRHTSSFSNLTLCYSDQQLSVAMGPEFLYSHTKFATELWICTVQCYIFLTGYRTHFNIILPSMPKSPKLSLTTRFSNQKFVCRSCTVSNDPQISISSMKSLRANNLTRKCTNYDGPYHATFLIFCYFIPVASDIFFVTLFRCGITQKLTKLQC
jgi:hypothetical protein